MRGISDNTVVAPTKVVTPTRAGKVIRIDRHRRPVPFPQFGYFDVVAAPAPDCFYNWYQAWPGAPCPRFRLLTSL
jgi:hypothetical protein